MYLEFTYFFRHNNINFSHCYDDSEIIWDFGMYMYKYCCCFFSLSMSEMEDWNWKFDSDIIFMLVALGAAACL